jgi:NifU-like protein involved in Fe-S cluster formation
MKEKLKLFEGSGYSRKAIKVYVDDVNVGMMKSPGLVETHISPCGDALRSYPILDRNVVLEDNESHNLSCLGLTTSTSGMTKVVEGRNIDQAKKMTEDDVPKELEGLPELKLEWCELTTTTFRKEIVD